MEHEGSLSFERTPLAADSDLRPSEIGTRVRGDVPASANAMARLQGTRLVEVRARRLGDRGELEWLDKQIGDAVRCADGPLLYADYRHASPVLPSVERLWSQAMRRANGRILRTAMLVDPANVLFNLQLQRMVKCTHNPMRRIFTDRDDLIDWLAGGCSEQERGVLRDVICDPIDARLIGPK